MLEADQAAGDHDERLVDVVAALPPDPQASVLMQPGDRPLDHPALASQAGAVSTLRTTEIARTDRPLAEIASEAGFADQSHFTLLFGHHVGITLARYREETQPAFQDR